MKEVLTDLSVWTGSIIGTLTIVDWLLVDRQKKQLKKRAENFWVWLATREFRKYTGLFLNRKFHLVGIALAAYVMILLNIILPSISEEFKFFAAFSGRYSQLAEIGSTNQYLIAYGIAVIALSAFLFWRFGMNRLFNWLVQKNSFLNYFLRLIGLGLISFILVIALSFVVNLAVIPFLGLLNAEDYFMWTESISVLFHIPLFMLIVVLESLLILSLSWIFIYAPILMIVFKILEFVIYRIIENEKGIVLGISGLLVGIGLIVKALS